MSEEYDHDHEEGHTDADGFILEDAAGNEMYREFEGAMTGSVTLAVGDLSLIHISEPTRPY